MKSLNAKTSSGIGTCFDIPANQSKKMKSFNGMEIGCFSTSTIEITNDGDGNLFEPEKKEELPFQ